MLTIIIIIIVEVNLCMPWKKPNKYNNNYYYLCMFGTAGVHRDQFSDAGSRKTSENLDSLIRNQVGRQVDTLFVCAINYCQTIS